MHRFYLPPGQCCGNVLALTDREAHHAWHVLRVREGEHVVVLDGAGHVLNCEAGSHTRDTLVLRVLERNAIAPLPCAITLLQALPKGKIIEGIIQKATELGVQRIVPLLSERVVTQLDSESAEAKAEKWQQIAIEAIKQSGNPWLPKIEVPLTPEAFLARHESFELPLVGCLEPGSRHPRECFEKFRAQNKRSPETASAWIGPEGDFTSAEYDMLKKAKVLPITLGPLVLRVETAATYCLSVLNYEIFATR